ncbi:phage tail protein [Phyllobacterium phragmitis]|uniref:phage tail protein n=1 Tax=Phyllobacterium phragmitis TaxID=2670329 RepID=UPI00130499AD|nr:phage tail protein [Phyllobacterium phragmitis]
MLFALLASPAAADPVSIVVGIGSAASWLFGGTVLANIVLGGLAAAAQYALTAAFAKKPVAQASKTETQYGENLAREVGMGTYGTMGHHIYRNAFGKGNRMVQDVFNVSSFRTLGINRVQYNGKWMNLDGVDTAWGRKVLGIENGAEIWVRHYTGRMDQVADQQLIDNANPPGRWTSDHRGAGISYVIVTSRMEADNLTSPPSLMFEVRGAPLYDPRKDTTVGGSGAHRWNNQDTWEYSDNNAVMMYNLERGIYNGTELMVGRGAAASSLPLSEWFTAMNICDEPMVDGSKRYTAALIASSGDGVTHDSNMTPLREGCAGSWVEAVTGEYPIVGANQAVVTTFTDDDINFSKPFSLSLYRPTSELVNTVAGTYVSPEAFYETVPLATRIDAIALAQDGERKASKVSYTAVVDHRVGDRLADIAIRASRYQANANLCIHPKFLEIKVGQWISWQSDRYNFTKSFQVLTKSLGALGADGTRDVTVTLQEVGNGIFDPTAYETNPPVPTPVGDPDYLAEVQNFQVIPNKIIGSTGQELPGARLVWDPITDLSVAGVDIQYVPVSDVTQVFTHYATTDVTVVQLVEGLTSATDWETRTRLRVASGTRPVAWSAWKPFTTLDTGGDDSPVDYEDLANDLKGYVNWIGPELRELIRQAQELSALVGSNHNSNYEDRQLIRRELASTYGQATAKFEEEIYAATGPGSAIVQQLVTFGTELRTAENQIAANANITNLLQTRVDGIGDDVTAISNAVLDLNASKDGTLAGATFRMETVAAQAGYTSRIAMYGRVGSNDTWKQAGLFIDINSTTSRVSILADQFVISDGSNVVAPFVIQNGVLYAQNMVLDNLIVSQIRSTNSKLIMRGSGNLADLRVFT